MCEVWYDMVGSVSGRRSSIFESPEGGQRMAGLKNGKKAKDWIIEKSLGRQEIFLGLLVDDKDFRL